MFVVVSLVLPYVFITAMFVCLLWALRLCAYFVFFFFCSLNFAFYSVRNISDCVNLVIAFVYLVAPKRAVWFIARPAKISLPLLLLGRLCFLDYHRLLNFFLCASFLCCYLRFCWWLCDWWLLDCRLLGRILLWRRTFWWRFFLRRRLFLGNRFLRRNFLCSSGFLWLRHRLFTGRSGLFGRRFFLLFW